MRRQSQLRDGVWLDEVVMSILSHERPRARWESPKAERRIRRFSASPRACGGWPDHGVQAVSGQDIVPASAGIVRATRRSRTPTPSVADLVT